jgi:hypothetical protein
MIVSEWYHIPTLVSLGVIAVVLAITVWASLRASRRIEAAAAPGGEQ